MRTLSTQLLTPGMKVCRAVEDQQGRRLLPAGMELTDKHIRMLKIWGITRVDVETPAGEAEDSASAEEKSAAPEPLRETEIPHEVREDFMLTNLSHPLILELVHERLRRISTHPGAEMKGRDREREATLASGKAADLTGMTQAQDLIRSIGDLGSPPDVYTRLLKVINRPNSSSRDIADVIGSDQGLTARLLRLVNSSLYAFPTRIETVTRAVTIVGTAQLSDLALATSMVKSFDGIPGNVVDMDSFWRHGFSCAVVARTLAGLRREPNVERLFVSGLLHDVGRLVLFSHCGLQMVKAMTVCRFTARPLYAAEQEVLPFTHAQVGMALLKAWNLPACHSESVGWHHSPSMARHFPMEAMIVHIADIVTNAMHWGSSGQHKVPPLDAGTWEALELSPEIMPRLLSESEPQIRDVMNIILEDEN